MPRSWQPFLREADLARHCLAGGLNALFRASHTNTGLFNSAFFNLSIGLERLMKLIGVVNFAQLNGGTFPTQNEMKKKFGHDLVKLREQAEMIGDRLLNDNAHFEFHLPDPVLAGRIVGVLGEFAKATRYYNIDSLVGAKDLGRDPLTAWTDEVARYLMSGYPMRLRRRDEGWAAGTDQALGETSIVRQETVDGNPITTLSDSILHSSPGRWVQQTATFHCAAVVRELVQVLWALEDREPPPGAVRLPMIHEFFRTFYNDDAFLRNRRTFLD